MAGFKLAAPLTVPMALLVPTYGKSAGVPTKTFPAVADGIRINGNFKSYGGTETEVNGLYSVEDTAIVETWYRPEIQADCRIAVLGTGRIYEVIGEPEDIELRHQYIRMKVRRVKGGA